LTRNQDIQVLRGIAVSLVVLFHSGTIPVPAGFLGVDVFFVISGFLITSHIIRDVDRRIFSLAGFYVRRARRLLPATYCTLLVTTLAAPFLLVPSSWHDYIKSLFGALTFTANIFLWLQTGYFEQAAAFKPLLHLWSLSIEEQYYLVLPLFLLIAPRRWRVPLISVVLLLSAALYVLLMPYKPSATFFLLPTRVWELMIGSFLAGIVAKQPKLEAPAALKVTATATVILIPFFPIAQLHPFQFSQYQLPPAFDAILVTCATAVLLTGSGKWLSRLPITRALSHAGDWSYSIYLVHWPLYAFATNVFLGKIPTTVALLLMPVSYTLGYLQYRYVEQRFQFVWRDNNNQYLRYIMAASLAVVSLALLFPSVPTRAAAFRFDPDFVCKYGEFDNKPPCRYQRVALWGDSFATMWAPGLADALHGEGLVLISSTMCGPIDQLARIDNGPSTQLSKKWGEACIQFNREALRYIVTTKSIETVVLGSAFDYYMGTGYFSASSYLLGDKVERPDRKTLLRQFLSTLYALRTAGKKVIVIAPVPRTIGDINMGECLQRRAQTIFVTIFVLSGLRSDCSFTYDNYRMAQRPVIEFLRTVERLNHINVVWPESVTCDDQTCAAEIGGIPIYRDAWHITSDASILLTRMLHIAEKLNLTPQRLTNPAQFERATR
jgi:peptidoglycan/LPS O-acetylase OafA/YrhL